MKFSIVPIANPSKWNRSAVAGSSYRLEPFALTLSMTAVLIGVLLTQFQEKVKTHRRPLCRRAGHSEIGSCSEWIDQFQISSGGWGGGVESKASVSTDARLWRAHSAEISPNLDLMSVHAYFGNGSGIGIRSEVCSFVCERRSLGKVSSVSAPSPTRKLPGHESFS